MDSLGNVFHAAVHAAQAERRVTTLMGNKVEPRRKWIESHVQFTLEEDGSILDKKEDTVPELVDEKLMDTEQAESKHLVKE